MADKNPNWRIEPLGTDGDHPEVRYAVMLANNVLDWLDTATRDLVFTAIQYLRERNIVRAIDNAKFAFEDRLIVNLAIERYTIAEAAGRPMCYAQAVYGVPGSVRAKAKAKIERAVAGDTPAQTLRDLSDTIRNGVPFRNGKAIG